MFPTKILLATDGSEEAIRAAKMATTLSEKLDSAASPPSYSGPPRDRS